MSNFMFYFRLGWNHIISANALDHLYFISVLAVVYQFREWKQVLILVTAFTIGHALTLFLSAMDLFRLPDQAVEFAIPCTIMLSAILNFRKGGKSGQADKVQYAIALSFGLVHGMGYANAIRFMLSSDQQMAWSLLSFNAGLEIGQIFVVLLMLSLGLLVSAATSLTRREWVLIYSSFILGLALQIAIERNPFIQ
jgi:hypothetical protein